MGKGKLYLSSSFIQSQVLTKKEYFKNKTVWIVGASSGIGKELAIQLNELGATCILSARNKEALMSLQTDLGDKHHVLPLDLEKVCQPDEINRLNLFLKGIDGIDVLFNNGGLSQRAEAHETPLEVDRRLMEINYFGNIQLCKLLLPMWREGKSGHVVVISSIAGKFGFFLRSAYSASKHALHGFYESVRLEEEKNNIAVTVACPGKINTPISTNALNSSGERHGVMDHNQETGMPVETCVNELLQAVANKKHEILIGGKEIKAVTLKRFLPKLFYKIIRKQSAV